MSKAETPALLRKYRRFGRRLKRREGFDMHKMKPPYDGGNARRFGWPCVPPYKMKAHKKRVWRWQWWAADEGIRSYNDHAQAVLTASIK